MWNHIILSQLHDLMQYEDGQARQTGAQPIVKRALSRAACLTATGPEWLLTW